MRKDPNGILQIDALLDLVSHTYTEQDEERQKKDRSVKMMSEEMLDLNRKSMERHEAFVSALVENVVDGIVTIGSDLRITKANKAAMNMMGSEADELIGLHFESLFDQEEGACFLHVDLKQLSDGLECEMVAKSLTGNSFPIELSISQISAGDSEFFLAIIRDISQRKNTENMLIDAKVKAENLAQSKADFLSTMSHEIRTPLNAVIGMTSLLVETPMTREQLEYANTIKTGGESLLAIINDILDFSKIESGRLDLESVPFPTIEPIEDVMDLLASRAHAKGIDVMYTLEEQVPVMIQSDITRIRQVLVNLVGNAIKFTEKGQVLVTVSASSIIDRECEMTFSVKDTGIGIPQDRIARLFQSFSQVDASTTRKYGGSGLGLAICKGIVERMGGSIWVESEDGEGSSFIFTIMVKAEEKQTLEREAALNLLLGKRVLVVDDNELNLQILKKQLERWNLMVLCETLPHTALQKIRGGLEVDLVISDGLMPVMNGADFIRNLRKIKSKDELPAILFSSGMNRIEADLESMINGSISKPGRQKTLLQTISQALQLEVVPIDSLVPGKERMQLPPRLKTLLVEDNSVNQRVAIRMLSKLGIEADVVGNGLEAVNIATQIRYDLILMDMMMPVMDGLEATIEIRKMEEVSGHRSYIIAMTANVMKEDVDRCHAAGMDDFLSKPVRIEKLEETIFRWFATQAEHIEA
ncbi:MAG: response regulator [Bacteroidia bacterium]|nr:response regulator [Bacteroidia bacterium]